MLKKIEILIATYLTYSSSCVMMGMISPERELQRVVGDDLRQNAKAASNRTAFGRLTKRERPRWDRVEGLC